MFEVVGTAVVDRGVRQGSIGTIRMIRAKAETTLLIPNRVTLSKHPRGRLASNAVTAWKGQKGRRNDGERRVRTDAVLLDVVELGVGSLAGHAVLIRLHGQRCLREERKRWNRSGG